MEIKYIKNDKILKSKENENLDYKLEKEIISLNNGVRYIIKIHPKCQIELKKFFIKIDFPYHKDDLIMPNGYQSWTDSHTSKRNGRRRSSVYTPKLISKIYGFKYYGDWYIKKYGSRKGDFHAFTFASISSNNNDTLFASLNDKYYFTIFNFSTKNQVVVECDCEHKLLNTDSILLDFVVIQGKLPSLYKQYKELLGYDLKINRKINGYTSWYNYYQNINETILLNDLNALDSSYELFQIDDGYAPYEGDFLEVDENKFPHGLLPLVDKIHQKNMLAGIWIAPLVCEEKSSTFKLHPDWFVQDKNHKPLKIGTNWSGFYPLDFDKQEVKDYIKDILIQMVEKNKFDFLKIDFLYAGCIGVKDKSRGERMNEIMEFIRKYTPNTIILGCGLPLASAFNTCDYLRIGGDVSLSWDDAFYMKIMHRERISTKITLQNTINRFYISGVGFLNDPDVYILRKNNNTLTQEQKKALYIINSIFGSLIMTSDNVSTYDEETKSMYHQYEEYRYHQVEKITYPSKNIIEFTTSYKDQRYHFIYNKKIGDLQINKLGE